MEYHVIQPSFRDEDDDEVDFDRRSTKVPMTSERRRHGTIVTLALQHMIDDDDGDGSDGGGRMVSIMFRDLCGGCTFIHTQAPAYIYQSQNKEVSRTILHYFVQSPRNVSADHPS